MRDEPRRALVLAVLSSLAVVSLPGCYLFYPGYSRFAVAVYQKKILPGSRPGEVREVVGEPRHVETEGEEMVWLYRERWADGIDISRQIVLGFLTFGVFWFLPPEAEYHQAIFQKEALAAVIHLGNSPEAPRPSRGASTTVTTEPAGARIAVDGFHLGRSPLQLHWNAPTHRGEYFADRDHTITASLEDDSSCSREMKIPGGRFIFHDLERIPPSVHLDLTTPPEPTLKPAPDS
jgi:hypothetical protein